MRSPAVILGALLAAGPLYSAELVNSCYYGSRRAAFLTQSAGARPVGMGEAFTAVADDISALSWNPGGLGRLDSLQGVAMYNVVGEGIGLSYLAAAVPVGVGVVGGSLAILSFGNYVKRDAYGVKLGTEEVTDAAGSVSFAFRHPDWTGLGGTSGVTLEVVKETVSSNLLGVSAGSVLPVGDKFMVGWSIQHLGPPADGSRLPGAVRVGGSYGLMPSLKVAGDFMYGLTKLGVALSFGTEYVPYPFLAIRAGYKWRALDQGLRGLSGFTAGAGIRLNRFGLDYAYQPFGDLITSHRISVVFNLPMKPVKTVAKPKLSDVDRLYKAGRYDLALEKITPLLKSEAGNWKVWQLRGDCLYDKGNVPEALDSYRRSFKLNPANRALKVKMNGISALMKETNGKEEKARKDSDGTPIPNLEEVRRVYKAGRYAEAAGQVDKILVVDSKNWRAWELLGNCRYALKDWPAALTAFKIALKLHPSSLRLKKLVRDLKRKRTGKSSVQRAGANATELLGKENHQ